MAGEVISKPLMRPINPSPDFNPPEKKKRNLPGTPNPEAEVIALSPRTLMATNRFVCEICRKGFQRDQNLQLHRRGHNLPWKLRQHSSKEPRKRVYVCPEKSCVHHNPGRALGDLTGIKKQHYPMPALAATYASATAFLQKAAQIGVTSSTVPFMGRFEVTRARTVNGAGDRFQGQKDDLGNFAALKDDLGGETRDFLGVGLMQSLSHVGLMQSLSHPSINGWI